MTYRPDIDGLRALAVLSVVLCHVGLGFPGGYVGVDVFFVISGYLITCLMLKDVDAGKFSLVHFWERRTRRILPALAFVVAASFVGGWFLLAPTAYHSFGQSVCELVLMKANIHFSHDTGYFAAASESKPLLHTWSLAVEEQFYVLVPLLFWFASKFARRRWLEPVVMTLAAVSFIAAAYGIAHENQNTYYALWTRAWELLAGVGLAVRLHRRPFVGVKWRELWATAGLAGIVLPCFLYDHRTPFPGPAALAPVAGAMLLIGLGSDAERKTWVHRLLSTSGAVYIGLISYSLYLWHWPLIVYFKHLYIAPPTTFEKLAIVFASIALADVTRRLIETPFRTRTLLATRPRVFAAAAVVVVALHSGGKLIRSTEGFANRLPTQVREYAATGEMDHRFMVYQLPDDVPNKLLRVGADDVVPSVLVWGDSHGMAIMPAVDRVCREQGIAARGALYAGWSPVVEHLSEESANTVETARTFDSAIKAYLKSGEIRAVVLAAHWNRYRAHPRFAESLVQAVAELRGMKCDVYFMKDVPEYDYDVVAKLTQCAWRGHDTDTVRMTAEEYAAKNKFYDELLPKLTAQGAKILDPIPSMQAFTHTPELRPCDAGGMFYRDSHHLSAYGSKLIDPMLKPVAAAIAAEHLSRTARTTPGTATQLR